MMLLKLLQLWGHQRWLPYGIRDRLLRLLVPPERMGGQVFESDIQGLNYTGDLGNFIDWSVFFYGTYEGGIQSLLGKIADLAGSGSVFWDVGANVGLHSLFMTRHARLIASFEPWGPALSRLQDAVARNGLNNVIVHPFALGAQDDELPFYAPATANLGTGSFCSEVNINQFLGTLPIRRGDTIAQDMKLDRLDIMKIDTEGFEFQVLSGLSHTLQRFQPVLVVEISTLAHQRDMLAELRMLLPADWHILWVDEHPEHYRLYQTMPENRLSVTFVAGPPEKIRHLPMTG